MNGTVCGIPWLRIELKKKELKSQVYPDYVDDRSTETAAAQKPIWKHLKYTISEF